MCGLLFSPAVPPGLSMHQCGAAESPATTLWDLLAVAWPSPLHNPPPRWVCLPLPCCMSSPPRPPVSTPPMVWMNVSSLSPRLSDFHTILFSVSSVFLFVFKLLLSFFWLCEEAQCVYLCLHLGFSPGLWIQILNLDFWPRWRRR